MSKTFISILGTNDYLESFHIFNEKRLGSTPVKYVQEDLIKYFCKNWDSDSEIRIFLTNEAKEKNWLDNGHAGKMNLGLQNRLKALNLKSSIKPIDIPSGNNEKELWEIFEKIFESFKENDEVIVDITHSFRFLPMLLTVMLNYTRQIKKINIEGVYYAAFETLGPIKKVAEWDIEKRNTPIFDITQLVKLQEWTLATYDYTVNANTFSLNKLVKNEISTILSDTKTLGDSEILLRNTIGLLEKVSQNIALCRGNEIINLNYEEILSNLKKLKEADLVLKPVKLLIDKIEQKISVFKKDEITRGMAAVKWAMEHKLYQQAITLLQEVVITKILMNINLDYSDLEHREIVSSAIKIKSQEIPEKNWKGKAGENKGTTRKILEEPLTDKIKSDYEKLTSIRNDVNHAGFLKRSKKYQSITDKLKHIYEHIGELLINRHAY